MMKNVGPFQINWCLIPKLMFGVSLIIKTPTIIPQRIISRYPGISTKAKKPNNAKSNKFIFFYTRNNIPFFGP